MKAIVPLFRSPVSRTRSCAGDLGPAVEGAIVLGLFAAG